MTTLWVITAFAAVGVAYFVYLAIRDGRRAERDVARLRIFDRQPEWEVVEAREGDALIGYNVRWSEPDAEGRYLWVGHYYAGENGEPSLRWCEHAAERDAANKNLRGTAPWEYDRPAREA